MNQDKMKVNKQIELSVFYIVLLNGNVCSPFLKEKDVDTLTHKNKIQTSDLLQVVFEII